MVRWSALIPSVRASVQVGASGNLRQSAPGTTHARARVIVFRHPSRAVASAPLHQQQQQQPTGAVNARGSTARSVLRPCVYGGPYLPTQPAGTGTTRVDCVNRSLVRLVVPAEGKGLS